MHKVSRVSERRLLGWDNRGVQAWLDSSAILLRKLRKDPTYLEHWRPICLTSELFTWYEKYVWQNTRETVRPLPGWMLGFRPGYQPLDVAGLLQGTLAKAADRGQPVVILAMDISAAFDNLQSCHVARGLRERGATAAQVAAVLRETRSRRTQQMPKDFGFLSTEGPANAQQEAPMHGMLPLPVQWKQR